MEIKQEGASFDSVNVNEIGMIMAWKAGDVEVDIPMDEIESAESMEEEIDEEDELSEVNELEEGISIFEGDEYSDTEENIDEIDSAVEDDNM